MKTEKMYALLSEMIRVHDAETGHTFGKAVLADPASCVGTALPFYGEAAEMLTTLLEKLDTKATSRTALAAVKRMALNNSLEERRGVFKDGSLYCVCDGYRALRLVNDYSSLPHVDAFISLEGTFSDIKPDYDNPVSLPSAAELKAFIAETKTRKNFVMPYKLWEDGFFNPVYLLDLLQALPNATAYRDTVKKYKGLSQLVLVDGNGNDGIILPVSPCKQYTDFWAEREAAANMPVPVEDSTDSGMAAACNGGEAKELLPAPVAESCPGCVVIAQPEAASLNSVFTRLDSMITYSWYENARIDYGVTGKLINVEGVGNSCRIIWEEDGKRYARVISWYKEYSVEQLYNIWMEGDDIEELCEDPAK